MKPTIYLVCQVSEQKSDCLSLLESWPFPGHSAILQADHLSDSMRWLLLQLAQRFMSVELQYFAQNATVNGEERQFLLELEERGMSVSIERECSVGMSLYAARRRCRYHIERADAVLIVCDQMTTEIQNLIRYAEKNHTTASVLCCKDS